MPTVTIKHIIPIENYRGGKLLLVWADVDVADGEIIYARDLWLKTILDVEIHSKDTYINASGIVTNPGSYDNYVTIYGSDVSGSVATAAGTFTAVIKAIGI